MPDWVPYANLALNVLILPLLALLWRMSRDIAVLQTEVAARTSNHLDLKNQLQQMNEQMLNSALKATAAATSAAAAVESIRADMDNRFNSVSKDLGVISNEVLRIRNTLYEWASHIGWVDQQRRKE